MRRLAALGLLSSVLACECARVREDILYACDSQGRCEQPGYVCVEGLCLPLVGDAGCLRRECEPDTCGTIDDDCGGLIDCGGCPSGQACGVRASRDAGFDVLPNRCAPCAASGADLPDTDLVDANCDGIDGEIAQGVFVDVVAGHDENPGTQEAPVKTLGKGLDRAAQLARPHLYVSRGTYEETLTIERAVSIYGGYDAAKGWSRAPERDLTILRASSEGTRLRGFGQLAILERVKLVSANAEEPGLPSVAVTVQSAQVTIRHSVVSAGAGARGADGADGLLGPDGEPGGPGKDGYFLPTVAAGGDGGLNLFCRDTTGGGKGGAGSNYPSSGAGVVGGRSAAGVAGGRGGNTFMCLSCDAGACVEVDDTPVPLKGDDGSEGGNGGHGLGGSGPGSLVDGGWLPPNGKHGGPGIHGQGGGGGGGGGALLIEATGCPLDGGYETNGGGGGGGGAGGCGGLPGSGGQGGGASIGLLVRQSSFSMEDVTVETSAGGAGGAGGRGAPGGRGGAGGPGGAGKLSVRGGWSSPGAAGGSGGDGGHGGHGGGGGGGPSVGLWCELTNPSLTTVDFQLGQGGPGGASLSSPGDGGESFETIGCP